MGIYQILAFAPNSWSGPWMNRQQLLSRLAKNNPVIYSNGLWMTWDRNRQHWINASWSGRFHKQDGVLIDEAPKWLLRYPKIRAIDNMAIEMGIRRLSRRLQTEGRGQHINYLFHPSFAPYVRKVRSQYLVFHAYDQFRLTPGWTDELDSWQIELASKADLVIASSNAIAEDLKGFSRTEVKVLPNGVDYDAFCVEPGSVDEPDDLSNVPHPRIGYIGNLNRKVDYQLIAKLAAEHGDWNFVFVGDSGSLDETAKRGFEVCQRSSNVHFMGGKNHLDLPAYVAGMDVTLMCYRVGDGLWTSGGYPLKMHEYLASGKPVISSNLQSVQEFSDVVAIATEDDEWGYLIEEALNGRGKGSKETRRKIAHQNSWNNRVMQLDKWLHSMVSAQVL